MNHDSIKAAIEATGSAILGDAAKARARPAPACARLLDGLRCEITGPRGETAYTDMPPAMGGAASAPNPGWLLRGSIASCTATVIAMRAAKLGLRLDVLEVAVESESDSRGMLGLDERVSAGFSALRMRVKIGCEGADPAKLRELVEWGNAHSPVGCTVRQAPSTTVEVEIV
jgi:uncharacterized OsmC-like protein